MSQKTEIHLNNATIALTDLQFNYLGYLLLSPSRDSAAHIGSINSRAIGAHIERNLPDGASPGFLKLFGVKNFDSIRNAMILEDLSFRSSIHEYGKELIGGHTPKKLSKRLDEISSWLFSGLSYEEIARELSIETRGLRSHIYLIGKRILPENVEHTRFNICAALLTLGYPKEVQGISIDLNSYTKNLLSRR